MRVIGFDPGLQRTGWGVVDVAGSRLTHVANGVAVSGAGSLAERLCRLHAALVAVVAAQRPDAAAVEHTFVNKDAAGTLKLGQARAMALLAPAQAGIAVAEYAPNAVKKAVVGVGHAQKAQVAHMVRHLLPGARIESPDAADALAVAICHAWQAGAAGRLAAGRRAAGEQTAGEQAAGRRASGGGAAG
ncbi:MAG: crossover junction endodeoxyribonuclease RuvC, partial [Pseudomonadota bacterium]